MTIAELIFESNQDDPSQEKVIDAVENRGVEMSRNAYDRAVDRARRAADVSGSVSETQVDAILDDAITGTEVFQGVTESFR